ncbi:MAG: hypothetical protein AB7F99_11280, partial [Vicinamibacterales bacterium]
SDLLLQSVAIALAVVIVAATSSVAGTIVRVRTVPIEAVNIAPGLMVVDHWRLPLKCGCAEARGRWTPWKAPS